MTKSEINSNTLNELSMVEPPYNKLYDLNLNIDNSLSAKVDNEYLYTLEGGPIGVAESGRHIAILGSIVLANDYNFGEKCYFLAIHANLIRESNDIQISTTLELTVKTIQKEKRTASIYGEIFDLNGRLIFSINVTYQVLRENTFTRLYKNNRFDNHTINEISPYVNRKRFQNIRINNTQAIGHYGTIEPNDCLGHFKNYPALPVAIVGNLFIELGMELFKKNSHCFFSKIIVLKTEIKALRLAFSGEEISFSTKIKKCNSNGSLVISGQATVKDNIVSTIKFELFGLTKV